MVVPGVPKKRNPYIISKYPNSFKTARFFWFLKRSKVLSFDQVMGLWSSIRVAFFLGHPVVVGEFSLIRPTVNIKCKNNCAVPPWSMSQKYIENSYFLRLQILCENCESFKNIYLQWRYCTFQDIILRGGYTQRRETSSFLDLET